MSEVIPLLPQYAFMVWCLVKRRDNFTGQCKIPLGTHIFLFATLTSHSFTSLNSSVSTVTGLQATGLIPGRGTEGISFSLSLLPDRLWRPLFPIQWVPRALTPGIKLSEREYNHSPPSSAEVKKGRIFTSTRPYVFKSCYLVKHRNDSNFTFNTSTRNTSLWHGA
jgi:hypothetical protein